MVNPTLIFIMSLECPIRKFALNAPIRSKMPSWHDLCNKGMHKIPTCPIIFSTKLCLWWKPKQEDSRRPTTQNKIKRKTFYCKESKDLIIRKMQCCTYMSEFNWSNSFTAPFHLYYTTVPIFSFCCWWTDGILWAHQHTQCTVTCQIIRSWATMLVMSASLCPACIYDLLAVRVVLSCVHEVKAIKVTSPRETTQHLSSSFTPSAARVSLDLPARRCTRFPLIRNSLILLSEHGR